MYQFERFSMDTERLELRADGALVEVQPQVFSLIVYLVENRARVVTKDEVFDEVWEGRIVSDGTISWPVGFGGAFHGELTGAQNIRFVARVYRVDTMQLLAFVEDFAELGKHFHMPVRSYSSGMRSRLAFGASMGIRFDTYLVDEVTAVGDARFKRKSAAVFKERMKTSSAILVSHEMTQIRQFCDAGIVLENGHLRYYADIEEAIEAHQDQLR